MATLTLKIEGELPKGIKPDTIRVEPKCGTFALVDSSNADAPDRLAIGQFSDRR